MTSNSVELPFRTPSRYETVHLILRILLKSVPFTKGNRARLVVNASNDAFDLPAINYHGPLTITETDIEVFNTAVSHQDLDADFGINPFFFASFCQPIIMTTIANEVCPFRPVGSVNTRNIFIFHDASMCRDPTAILTASRNGRLTYTSKFGGNELQGQRRKRGVECEIVIDVKHSGETIFTLNALFLQFLPKSHPPLFEETKDFDQKKSDSEAEAEIIGVVTNTFSMTPKHPHRWAASCSDYNPIHISTIAAKMLGFPSTIAHGNHVVALAIQELLFNSTEKDVLEHESKVMSEPQKMLLGPNFCLQVSMVKPVLLPADLTVSWKIVEEALLGLSINDAKGKTCITGECKL